MSSDNHSRPRVRVSVDLASDVSLQIASSKGEILTTATGGFEGELPAGRYEFQAERDGLVRTKSAWLTPGGTGVSLTQEDFDLTYRSAAPLEGVRRGIKEDKMPEEHAARESRLGPCKQIGSGSELFVFVRAADVSSRKNPARDVRLYSLEGELLVDLGEENVSLVVASDTSWASARLALDPGNYILRCYSGSRHFDRIVTTAAPLQTQVFLTYGRTDRDHWGIDPKVSSVLANDLDSGFEPGNHHSRLADLMLRALDMGEFRLDREVVADAMIEKIKDPMLGVFLGVYLASSIQADESRSRSSSRYSDFFANKDRARHRIEMILQNVAPRFPGNADLTILEAWFKATSGEHVSDHGHLELPPMLATSWRLARQTSLSKSDFILPSSLAFRAALDPIAAGPWFSWHSMDLRRELMGSAEQEINQEAIDNFVAAVQAVKEPSVDIGRENIEHVIAQSSSDSSLAEIYERVRENAEQSRAAPNIPTLDAKELVALSRYEVIGPEQSRDGGLAMRDVITGATISPADGVASLGRQLGRSLTTVISSLKAYKD